MYKRMILIFVFLLCCMFMPIVHAEEIPREGVTYFLQYPDGSEDVKESYDEAIAATEEEKIIFEGTTDSNGQVTIENIGDTGEVRIVQTVPDGYSTKNEEIKVNLSQKKEVQMTDTLKIINVVTNPKTGMSFILFIFVIGLVIVTIKVNKNKKILTVIPLIIVVSLFCNVKAENDDFTVTVKDNFGNGIANVPIKVFAKPVIDAAPAVKFDANGGYFYDGQTVMYYRIPFNGCSWIDLENSISDDEWDYLNGNTYYNVYRQGYYPDGRDELDTLSNGTVIKNYWREDPDAKVLIIYGNGEKFDFYGHELDKIAIYYDNLKDSDTFMLNDKYTGFSTNSSCENVPIGTMPSYRIEQLNNPSEVYLCFSDKQDGIYVNDQVFGGIPDSCFMNNALHTSYYDNNENLIRFDENYFHLDIGGFDDQFLNFYHTFNDCSNGIGNCFYQQVPITKIEFIYGGKSIASFGATDIGSDGVDGKYYINNLEKNNQVKEYLNVWINKAKNGQCPNLCDYIWCAQ